MQPILFHEMSVSWTEIAVQHVLMSSPPWCIPPPQKDGLSFRPPLPIQTVKHHSSAERKKAKIVFQNLVVCSSEIGRGPVPCPAHDHVATYSMPNSLECQFTAGGCFLPLVSLLITKPFSKNHMSIKAQKPVKE